jgi:hypothetical protein
VLSNQLFKKEDIKHLKQHFTQHAKQLLKNEDAEGGRMFKAPYTKKIVVKRLKVLEQKKPGGFSKMDALDVANYLENYEKRNEDAKKLLVRYVGDEKAVEDVKKEHYMKRNNKMTKTLQDAEVKHKKMISKNNEMEREIVGTMGDIVKRADIQVQKMKARNRSLQK